MQPSAVKKDIISVHVRRGCTEEAPLWRSKLAHLGAGDAQLRLERVQLALQVHSVVLQVHYAVHVCLACD